MPAEQRGAAEHVVDPQPQRALHPQGQIVTDEPLGVAQHAAGDPERTDGGDRHHQVEDRGMLSGPGQQPRRHPHQGHRRTRGAGGEQHRGEHPGPALGDRPQQGGEQHSRPGFAGRAGRPGHDGRT
ncbi:hypothetical protein SDC9_161593 [bioreactor metagenome]|uniref:Uncharacterized protein n=1 Tax=bioreactor metagenome TaxID=1076179 RepID=A0A645FIT2_9ZZZZ